MLHHLKVHYNDFPGEVLAHEAYVSVKPGETNELAIIMWNVENGPKFNLHMIENGAGKQMRELYT